MKLYSYYRSTSSWRVRIVLAFKGIDYEYCAVNLAPGFTEQFADGYERINPMRQVPVLEWEQDGKTRRLTQSVAIVEYLEEKYPKPALLPSDPLRRAWVREAVEIVNSGIQPLQNSKTLAAVRALAGETAVVQWAGDAIRDGLDSLEEVARARGGAYLVGDDVSLADVYLVPQLRNARRFGLDVSPFDRLIAIEERTHGLEAFLQARPEAQPDSPRPEGSKP